VGGYAWASKGFDFVDATTAHRFVDVSIEKIGVALRQFESTGRLPKGITEADLRSLAAYMDDLREGRKVTSAPEIARFGRQPGQGGKDAMWPGKWLMLGSSWAGRMPL